MNTLDLSQAVEKGILTVSFIEAKSYYLRP